MCAFLVFEKMTNMDCCLLIQSNTEDVTKKKGRLSAIRAVSAINATLLRIFGGQRLAWFQCEINCGMD